MNKSRHCVDRTLTRSLQEAGADRVHASAREFHNCLRAPTWLWRVAALGEKERKGDVA